VADPVVVVECPIKQSALNVARSLGNGDILVSVVVVSSVVVELSSVVAVASDVVVMVDKVVRDAEVAVVTADVSETVWLGKAVAVPR